MSLDLPKTGNYQLPIYANSIYILIVNVINKEFVGGTLFQFTKNHHNSQN